VVIIQNVVPYLDGLTVFNQLMLSAQNAKRKLQSVIHVRIKVVIVAENFQTFGTKILG